jgi:hypothetical protein
MIKITREAYRVLYEATVARVPGPYVSTDQNEIETNFPPEVVAWIEEYARPGETISDTIIRLSGELVTLMRNGM